MCVARELVVEKRICRCNATKETPNTEEPLIPPIDGDYWGRSYIQPIHKTIGEII